MRQQKTHTFVLLGLGVLLGACRTSDVSIMVKALQPLDEDCRVVTDYVKGGGSLNINASSEYLLSVVMESVIEGVDREGAGGRLLSSEKENRVILTEWTRQYFVYGAGGTSKRIAEESEPLAGILEPNADTQLFMPLSMLGPTGAHTLRRLLQQSSPGVLTENRNAFIGAEIVVRFQIQGKIVSSGKKVETAAMDFPVFVYLGLPLPECTEEEKLAPVGPCGLYGGQDGFDPICCELDSTGKKCKNN